MSILKLSKTIRATVIASARLAALAGCQKHEVGTAEKAGKEIDKTAATVGQQIDKAGERVQETAKDAGKAIDQAVAKVGQEVEKAGVRIQQSAREEPTKDDRK